MRAYLEDARIVGAKPAFDDLDKIGVRAPRPYRPLDGLETVPYVCLRLPTGGGKTLLSAHTVKIAADAYLEREFPVVLWLVPTNTIRAQTLETLKKPEQSQLRSAARSLRRALSRLRYRRLCPNHPRRLSDSCLHRRRHDADLARQQARTGRKVYAHNENLEPHFSAVPQNAQGLERIEDGDDKGQIKFSFRNLLALHRPLVIVDEAHNNTLGPELRSLAARERRLRSRIHRHARRR